jgi:hypothetical protein
MLKNELVMRMMLLTTTVLFGLLSCCHNAAQISIKPLHPYSASPYYHKQNETKKQNYINKYFFIEGACKSTVSLSKQVDSFLISYIKGDTDFVDYGDYYVDFYRRTKEINENFREVTDGMISHNTLDEHDEDLLYRYMWSDKDFMGCEYYKNGKVIKTVYDKGGDIFKRNPALPLPDTGRVIIKEVPSNNE